MAQPVAITDGKTYIELEHSIGLNIECHQPVHYLAASNVANENEQKQAANYNDTESAAMDYNYLSVCGSCIVLSSFHNAHNQSFLRGHTSYIECCAVSPDKQWIASAQRGSTPDVYVWSAGKLVYKLEQHAKAVSRVSFSDDSRFLATVGSAADNKMYIWDMQSGYIVTSSVINPSPCNAIVWGGRVKDIKRRPTTDYLFATCGIEQVRIWAMTPSSGKLLSEKCNTSNLHSRRVFTCLTFSDTADLLIAGTETGDFFIFDVRRLAALTSFQTNCVGGIHCILSCKLQGQYIHDPLSQHYFIKIIVGCGDGAISIWEYDDDLETFIEQHKLTIPDGGIQCMDMHTDRADTLLIATSKGNVREIDISSASKAKTKPKHKHNNINALILQNHKNAKNSEICNKAKSRAISFNETSSIIGIKIPSQTASDSFVTVSEHGSIRKWSMNDYSILLSHDLNGIGNGTKACCFDFNDEVMITGWSDGSVRAYNSNKSNDGLLWDIRNAHEGGVTSLRFGFNEKYIISAGVDGTLRAWDVRFKKLECHLKEHTSGINAVEVYSDSRHVLTCSKDRSFICWDFATQKRVSCHRQNMGAINDIKLSRDEQTVITVGGDQCVTFWDIRQPKAVQCIKSAHDADISCIRLSNQASSNFIATADVQSTLKIWDAKTFRLVAKQEAFCGRINGIAFTYDDKQIVSVADDSSIMLWNIFTM
eukprot:CAMPEP_0197026438 /NCGR_PEP_ID=MMETSP1384-20130603/6521_1 /TAXON_ID=29189 /ORGANISM="Ammonia sp." /LENGTH=705 /DNA_ID=CAMNT_0042455099 /DNA_START=33 /DNA_END=2150 /DNA_ORIENTATION=-